MKKHLVVFHPALAPYRVDFFNSLNEAFDAVFYFEFGNALEQDFDQQKLQSRLTFRPKFLKPGFAGIKNLRLDVWTILRKEKPDIVCISEYNILGLLVVLYKLLTGSRFRVVTICDDNRVMACTAGFVKRMTRAVLLCFLYAVVLADKSALSWYQQRWGNLCKWIYFPIIQAEESFRSRLKEALPLTEAYRKQYDLDHKKVILYVGRLAEVKNIPLLLRSYKQLKEKDTVLLIVGDGPLKNELQEACCNLKIEDSVLFVGKKEGLDLMAYYNLGDIFVLPSRYEPFGTVVNEALLAGCYLLCSNVAGAASLIEEGVNGNIFDVKDEKELEEKLGGQLRLIHKNGNADNDIKKNRMRQKYNDMFNVLKNGISG